jgi:hypothetical protein
MITKITNEQIREGAAYHEAGHAVIATTRGWNVNHEGVEIDDRAYTGLELSRFQYSTSNQIHVSLAGWLSEYKFHGLGGLTEDDELQCMLEMVRTPESADEDDLGSDDFIIFKALLEDYPDALDRELIAKYREYQIEVNEQLDDHNVWEAIENLAALLLEKGKVESEEANVLIGAILKDY